MAESKIIEHRDRLGRLIKIGDFVATPHNNRLAVGIINKLNPKMIQFKEVSKEKYWHGRKYNKYPEDTIVVEGPEVSVYLLKNSS